MCGGFGSFSVHVIWGERSCELNVGVVVRGQRGKRLGEGGFVNRRGLSTSNFTPSKILII